LDVQHLGQVKISPAS